MVDTFVTRQYLDRVVDPDDRRLLLVRLTTRGAAAASAVRGGPEFVAHARATLSALVTDA